MTAQGLEIILSSVSLVFAAGGGIGLVAFTVLRFLGDKWLTNRFEQKLATFRHEQQKELERIKLDIGAILDRKIKATQREFETIPKLWALMIDYCTYTLGITSRVQEYDNVRKMTAPQLEDFLAETGFREWQKDAIRSATDRQAAYQDAYHRSRLSKAYEKAREFRLEFLRSSIFLPKSIREKFDNIDELTYKALTEYQANLEDGGRREYESINELSRSWGPCRSELEILIQQHFLVLEQQSKID